LGERQGGGGPRQGLIQLAVHVTGIHKNLQKKSSWVFVIFVPSWLRRFVVTSLCLPKEKASRRVGHEAFVGLTS
jgi:hypothetical protein